jgi:hypothetical protein
VTRAGEFRALQTPLVWFRGQTAPTAPLIDSHEHRRQVQQPRPCAACRLGRCPRPAGGIFRSRDHDCAHLWTSASDNTAAWAHPAAHPYICRPIRAPVLTPYPPTAPAPSHSPSHQDHITSSADLRVCVQPTTPCSANGCRIPHQPSLIALVGKSVYRRGSLGLVLFAPKQATRHCGEGGTGVHYAYNQGSSGCPHLGAGQGFQQGARFTTVSNRNAAAAGR